MVEMDSSGKKYAILIGKTGASLLSLSGIGTDYAGALTTS
jgi:hypothetical protein